MIFRGEVIFQESVSEIEDNPSFTAKMNFGAFCPETGGGDSRN